MAITLLLFVAQITLAASVAGTWQLPLFWFVFGTHASIVCIGSLYVDIDLIKERLLPPRSEDRDCFGPLILSVLYPVHVIIAAADVGWWHWSYQMPFVIQVLALMVLAAGWTGFMWTMSSNKFFSSVIRLQRDRGHEIVTGGPYRIIRHPGYLFLTIALTSQAVALGSLLSCIPILLIVAQLIYRTTLEERLLAQELPGYTTYMTEVAFRWVPYLW